MAEKATKSEEMNHGGEKKHEKTKRDKKKRNLNKQNRSDKKRADPSDKLISEFSKLTLEDKIKLKKALKLNVNMDPSAKTSQKKVRFIETSRSSKEGDNKTEGSSSVDQASVKQLPSHRLD